MSQATIHPNIHHHLDRVQQAQPAQALLESFKRFRVVKVEKSIYLIVLQSNGSIHVVDPAQGTIAYQYAAEVG